LLFHYFSNKKQLYANVLNSGLERIAAFMASETPKPPADLFDLVLSNSYAKVKFYVQEPYELM
jgi:AcrR family transcriptional regulator